MSTEDLPRGDTTIQSDEDWKEQVKAEDAAFDEQFRKPDQAASGPATEVESDRGAAEMPLPPASLTTLVSMFSTQAMVALGVIPNPATGTSDPQLALARHFIDLLGVVEEKTRGNLDAGEHTLLENSLHQLRMLYVEQTRTGGTTKK